MTVLDDVDLPDPAGSWAVLVGVAGYTRLTPQPAIRSNLRELRSVLTDERLWGIPADQCRVMIDPSTSDAVKDELYEAGRRATEALIVYLAGHGLPGGDGKWFLALPTAHPDATHRAVNFDDIRALLERSRARLKVVVLDSCYSGRVLHTLAGSSIADVMKHRLDARGSYLMTACSGSREAMALPGEFTTFTGALLTTLREGVPGGPAHLPLPLVFSEVQRRITELGDRRVPAPCQGTFNGADRLAIVRNQASTVRPEVPAPTAPATRDRRRTFVAIAGGVLIAGAVAVTVPLLQSDPPRSAQPSIVPLHGSIRAGGDMCVESRSKSNGDPPDPAAPIVTSSCREYRNQAFTSIGTAPTEYKLRFDHSTSNEPYCLVATSTSAAGIAACDSSLPWRFLGVNSSADGRSSWQIQYTGFDSKYCLTLSTEDRVVMAECETDESKRNQTQQWWVNRQE
ncbi:hypothetical protein AB0J83_45615 [Actinoplanes sp. NPDC049596]|uniref:caspase, EACC1-associated type n=1 Tax=unclassified Actinoplanes TaxID=2626549 RepID=UPI00343A3921